MDITTALSHSGALRRKTSTRPSPHVALQGGLDIMDPAESIKPGQLIGCLNFEPGYSGGYRRFGGYERFDGRSSPSDSDYTAVSWSGSFTGATPAQGDTVTESGSGASGTVAYVDSTNKTLVLIGVSGIFLGNGSTLTSGSSSATSSGSAFQNGASTTDLSNTYYYQKWLYLQSFIGPVGGAASSGDVLGVVPYLGTVYAFRNNAAGTAADMWKATTSGWTKVSLGYKVRFDSGVYSSSMQPPAEGTTLTGASSGATFVIRRVVSTTGTWGTDAAGYFITDAITGTPSPGEALQVSGSTYANFVSSAAQTLPANGFYRFRTHNFKTAEDPTSGFRLYGVNGVGNGFEYDATNDVFVLIETGMTTDTPDHLEIHNDHLFYSFPGGSLQNSGYQLPLIWNPVFGADSRSVGQNVEFMRSDVSNTLVVGTRTAIWTLTGLTIENFQLHKFSTSGSISNSDTGVGQVVFGEDRGITTLGASQKYGNFAAASLTDPILNIVLRIGLSNAVGAIVTRYKNLYRVIFSTGAVLCIAINASGKWSGWTEGFYAHKPTCAFSGFTVASGVETERAFIGCNDGYVRELDKGRSFDGQKVYFFMKSSYWHVGTPDIEKRFRKLRVNLQPEGSATINMTVDCDFGSQTPQSFDNFAFGGGGGLWDVAVWDQFTWDQTTYQGFSMKVDLKGYNVSATVSGEAINDAPFTLNGMSYLYDLRILNRNTG